MDRIETNLEAPNDADELVHKTIRLRGEQVEDIDDGRRHVSELIVLPLLLLHNVLGGVDPVPKMLQELISKRGVKARAEQLEKASKSLKKWDREAPHIREVDENGAK